MTVLIILGISVILFVHGKIRADLVAFSAMLSLVVLGVLTPSEALSGFGDPIVFIIMGLFVVSAGVFRTGLAKMIGGKIIMLAGSNETKLYILMTVAATVMGVFITGSGTVALFIPIIVSMSISKNINVSRFLMPLGFVAGIGSSFTMMNSSNLAVQRILVQEGYTELKFFSLSPLGLVAAGIAIALLWILSKMFLSKRRYGESGRKNSQSFEELSKEYQLESKTFFAKIKNESQLIGKSLKELKVSESYNLNIIQVIHKSKSQPLRKPAKSELAGPRTVLRHDDKLELMGAKEDVERFVEENLLEFVSGERIDISAQGIAEVLLMPSSRMAGIQVKDSGFREKYNVNILAINRHGEYMTGNLREATMNIGDALLVQGSWADLSRLDEDYTNLVVVGKPLEEASKVTLDHKAPIAGIILALMIVLISTEILPTVAAVLLAAVMMIVTGCIRNIEEGYGAINWASIVLIASMMPMATALHKTGVDLAIANSLIDILGDKGPYALLAGLYFSILFMTFFINGTPLAVLFAPIGYQVAIAAGVSPYPFLVAVAASTNLYFASTFSSSINVMVMAAGRYTALDFIKVGMPLQIIIGIVAVVVIPLLFPF